MAKQVLLLLDDMVEDAEYLYPLLRFREAGFTVTPAAPEKRTYTGKKGMSFKPDTTYSEIYDRTFDAVFIPGGYAPDRFRRDKQLMQLLKRHDKAGKLIGAVCHGGWALISAGIAKGRRLTAYHAIKDDMVNAGADYTGNDVEVDDNLITATNPDTMLPMIRKMVEMLNRDA